MSLKKLIAICGLIFGNYFCENVFSMNQEEKNFGKEQTIPTCQTSITAQSSHAYIPQSQLPKVPITKGKSIPLYCPPKPLKHLHESVRDIIDDAINSLVKDSDGRLELHTSQNMFHSMKPYICINDLLMVLSHNCFYKNDKLIGLVLMRDGAVERESVVDCPNLRFMVISDNVVVQSGAFQKCKNLEFVIQLGEKGNCKSMRVINSGAFWDCPGFESMYFNNKHMIFRVPMKLNYIDTDMIIPTNLEQIFRILQNLRSVQSHIELKLSL